MSSDNPTAVQDEPHDCDPDNVETMSVEQVIDYAVNEDLNQRAWVRTLVGFMQTRCHGTDPSARVQLAFDLTYIAACERLRRILESDLPEIEPYGASPPGRDEG